MNERAAKRRGRFELLQAARSILYEADTPAAKQHATCWCHRSALGGRVDIFRAVDGSKARMIGVTTCGLVWTCPVCAAKVADQRREELQHAMVTHAGQGGAAYLMTLTFPHEREEYPLRDTLTREAKALQGFKNSRTYKRLLGNGGAAGRIGQVRSREVTHGRHGWHPHEHELIFCKRGAFGEGAAGDDGALRSSDIDALAGAWVGQLQKHGLCPNDKTDWAMRYALDMRGGDKAADYIAKFGRDEHWGASREMTGHLAKVGRRPVEGDKHRTPFQILFDASHGNAESWRLFREYADAFKGKRQLTWSPGLKKKLGVTADRTDEEIAADQAKRPEEAHVGFILAESLGLIASRRALGEFHEFIELACGDPEQSQACIDDFLNALRARPPSARPTYLQYRKTLDLDAGHVRRARVESYGPGTAMYEERL